MNSQHSSVGGSFLISQQEKHYNIVSQLAITPSNNLVLRMKMGLLEFPNNLLVIIASTNR